MNQVHGIHDTWAIDDFVIKMAPLYPQNLVFKQKIEKLELGPFLVGSKVLNVSNVGMRRRKGLKFYTRAGSLLRAILWFSFLYNTSHQSYGCKCS